MWQEKKRQPPARKPVRSEVLPAKGRRLDDVDALSLESGCRSFWELRQVERRVNNKERIAWRVKDERNLPNGIGP